MGRGPGAQLADVVRGQAGCSLDSERAASARGPRPKPRRPRRSCAAHIATYRGAPPGARARHRGRSGTPTRSSRPACSGMEWGRRRRPGTGARFSRRLDGPDQQIEDAHLREPSRMIPTTGAFPTSELPRGSAGPANRRDQLARAHVRAARNVLSLCQLVELPAVPILQRVTRLAVPLRTLLRLVWSARRVRSGRLAMVRFCVAARGALHVAPCGPVCFLVAMEAPSH
jgi:hypothetical protein